MCSGIFPLRFDCCEFTHVPARHMRAMGGGPRESGASCARWCCFYCSWFLEFVYWCFFFFVFNLLLALSNAFHPLSVPTTSSCFLAPSLALPPRSTAPAHHRSLVWPPPHPASLRPSLTSAPRTTRARRSPCRPTRVRVSSSGIAVVVYYFF